MRKDIKVGIGILFLSALLLWVSPIFGLIVYVMSGPVTLVGLWLIVNGFKKSKADRLSDQHGHVCYAKVLSIEPYSTDLKLKHKVDTLKRVLICVYDASVDRFVNVADMMEDKEIRFSVGDYIKVVFHVNDFNYMSNEAGLGSLPDMEREKFKRLINSCGVAMADSTDVNSKNLDTSGWTVTEEAYSDGMPFKASVDETQPDEKTIVEALINSVETVSAIEDFDAEKYGRISGIIVLSIVILFFISAVIFAVVANHLF